MRNFFKTPSTYLSLKWSAVKDQVKRTMGFLRREPKTLTLSKVSDGAYSRLKSETATKSFKKYSETKPISLNREGLPCAGLKPYLPSLIPSHLLKPRSRWTPELDQKLLQARKSTPKRTWKMLAAEHFPEFTLSWIHQRYSILNQFSVKGRWSEKELELLKEAVSSSGFDWMKVSRIVGTRDSIQCKKKWTLLVNPSTTRTLWSEDENEELVHLVLNCPEYKTEQRIPDYSDINWKLVSKSFYGKTVAQCKYHFINHLSGLVRAQLNILPYDKGSWSACQTEKLVSLIEQHPGNWALISCKLKTRSMVQYETRWKLLKTKLISLQVIDQNKRS